MSKIPSAKTTFIPHCIAPQAFALKDGQFFYFDRVNNFEGRFCMLDGNNSYELFETGEGQGIISSNADFYMLEIEEKTKISKYNNTGENEIIAELTGMYFDFKFDCSNNLICLGNNDGATVISIIGKQGNHIIDIKPNNLIFGSSINIIDDDIVLGAIDSNNLFKIIVLNYMGKITKEWNIKISSKNRIISKILKYNNNYIILSSGQKDSISILDINSGKLKEIYPYQIALKYFNDFNIYNNNIYILNDKKISEWDMEDFINLKAEKKGYKYHVDLDYSAYNCLLYFEILKRQLKSNIKVSLPAAFIIYMYAVSQKLLYGINLLTNITLFICFFWIINLSMSLIGIVFTITNKAKRIEFLLDIYNSNIVIKSYLLYSFVTFFCLDFLSEYPAYNLYLNLFNSIFFSSIIYVLAKISEKAVRKIKRDVYIELLNDGDNTLSCYVKKTLKLIKSKENEKLIVDLLIEGNDGLYTANKWAESRGKIIGHVVKLTQDNERLKAVIDLSNRDIKYARYCILMDYLSYLKRRVKVKDIEIKNTLDT